MTSRTTTLSMLAVIAAAVTAALAADPLPPDATYRALPTSDGFKPLPHVKQLTGG